MVLPLMVTFTLYRLSDFSFISLSISFNDVLEYNFLFLISFSISSKASEIDKFKLLDSCILFLLNSFFSFLLVYSIEELNILLISVKFLYSFIYILYSSSFMGSIFFNISSYSFKFFLSFENSI